MTLSTVEGSPERLSRLKTIMSDTHEASVNKSPDDAKGDESVQAGWLFCKRCAEPIVHVSSRVEVQGAYTHAFANPGGYFFRIGCFGSAPGCVASGVLTSNFSWFVGHMWHFASCRGCGRHLGWRYVKADDEIFFGVILDRVTESGVEEGRGE